ncbi:MAG: dephospho-CoA kinase, partial [Gammaproteobacteria bacterium]
VRMRRARLVGLTGGIGSGKTTVSKIFGEFGVPIIDSDEIARDLTRKGGTAYHAVAELFGPEALDAKGELRRDYLRRRVFGDDALLRKLEAIIHPLVYAEIERAAEKVNHPYCVVSIPLLVERGKVETLDRVLVVDLPEALQIERAAGRDDVPRSDIVSIMNRQASRSQRLQAADDVIRNDGDPESLAEQVSALHRKYLEIFSAGN